EVEEDAGLEDAEQLRCRAVPAPVELTVLVDDAGDEPRDADGHECQADEPREALGRDEPSHTRTLRRQALDDPALARRSVADPVVKAVDAVLPELPGGGQEAVAAPALGPLDALAHRPAQLRSRALELLAARDHFALRRDRRREPGAERPRAEVRVGLLRRE